VSYAHLVIALGSVTGLPDVPGLPDYGFGMKNLSDAMALRDRAVHMLEVADAVADPAERRTLLHFVVVGGSYTGVEVAGQFHTFLRQASRRYPNLQPEECQVTLVQRKDRILPTLDADLADYAAHHLRRLGVTIHLNTAAVKVEEERVYLDSREWLPTRTVIWCAGIAPNPFLKQLPVPRDGHGYILCERDLRVRGYETLWAIGDCAVNLDSEGKPYPATAQHAVRQGQHLAHNLACVMRGEAAEPCEIKSPGQLAALGSYRGVAKIYGLKFAGFPAWFLWRTVYLTKMPGWGRSLRVALDWFMEFFFSLDYVQLGVSTTRGSRPLDHDD
jgi:NADH dehydrogenase